MPQNDVGWDPAMLDTQFHNDLTTRLAEIYLLCTAIIVAGQILRWWFLLRFSTTTDSNIFDRALSALRDSNWVELRVIARKFSRRSLHRGLRAWSESSDASLPNAARTIVHHAAELFRTNWDREDIAVGRLRNWIGATQLVLAILSTTEVCNMLKGVAQKTSLGPSVLSAVMAQIGAFWVAGLWLILAMYLAHWYFSARLLRQQTIWRRFVRAVRATCSQ